MKGRLEASKDARGWSLVWVFLAVTFTLSWPVLIYGFGWCNAPEDVLKRYLLACAGTGLVAVSAWITRVIVERSGFEDVGWNLGRGRWYLAALGFCLVLWLGPPTAAHLAGQAQSFPPGAGDQDGFDGKSVPQAVEKFDGAVTGREAFEFPQRADFEPVFQPADQCLWKVGHAGERRDFLFLDPAENLLRPESGFPHILYIAAQFLEGFSADIAFS